MKDYYTICYFWGLSGFYIITHYTDILNMFLGFRINFFAFSGFSTKVSNEKMMWKPENLKTQKFYKIPRSCIIGHGCQYNHFWVIVFFNQGKHGKNDAKTQKIENLALCIMGLMQTCVHSVKVSNGYRCVKLNHILQKG